MKVTKFGRNSLLGILIVNIEMMLCSVGERYKLEAY